MLKQLLQQQINVYSDCPFDGHRSIASMLPFTSWVSWSPRSTYNSSEMELLSELLLGEQEFSKNFTSVDSSFLAVIAAPSDAPSSLQNGISLSSNSSIIWEDIWDMSCCNQDNKNVKIILLKYKWSLWNGCEYDNESQTIEFQIWAMCSWKRRIFQELESHTLWIIVICVQGLRRTRNGIVRYAIRT